MVIIIKGVDVELLEQIEKKIKPRGVIINHRGKNIDIEFPAGKKVAMEFLKKCKIV